jgi:hypothetical protein
MKENKKFNKELKRQIKAEKRHQNLKTKNMINYLVNKTKSPEKTAVEVTERIKAGLPPKKIEGINIVVPGVPVNKKLNKKDIKNMKPRDKNILIKRAAAAAKQAARAEKIIVPGINKNTAPNSISDFAMAAMKNRKFTFYNKCIDDKIFKFQNYDYIESTCKYIYGESVK